MNTATVVDYLVDWLRLQVSQAGKKGLVFGVSGGVDSAVVAVLAQKAFPEECMALLMPCQSNLDDLLHGQLLVEQFNIPYRILELDNAYKLLCTQYESYLKLEGDRGQLLRANIKPRLRMTTLCYSAQARDYLVAGTSNKSEWSVGYCTKYGDNAVDIQPLADFYKSEVYELARYLDIPEVIMDKPPSGGLWFGQTDEGEMGVTYNAIQQYFSGQGGDPESISRIEKMVQVSEHKRHLPPVAIIPRD